MLPKSKSLLWVLTLTLVFSACGKHAKPKQQTSSEVQAKPEATRVHPSRKELMYRYINPESGVFETALSISEVPKTARAKVVVYDPANDSPGWFFLADLRKAQSDGSFPCSVVHASQMKLVRTEKHVVRFFTASWCGVCTQARNFLKKEGIRFIEKDIEKDPGAAQEIQSFAKRKGVSPDRLNGVPIFIIGSEMLFGFDPTTLKRKANKG